MPFSYYETIFCEISSLLLYLPSAGLGYCWCQKTRIFGFSRVCYGNAGLGFWNIDYGCLIWIIWYQNLTLKLNVSCNKQLVALAQVGHDINSDILKTESRFTYLMSFVPVICLYWSLPCQMLPLFLVKHDTGSMCGCKDAELRSHDLFYMSVVNHLAWY